MSLVDEVEPEMTSGGGASFETMPASSGQFAVNLAALLPTAPPETYRLRPEELVQAAQVRAVPQLIMLRTAAEVHGRPLINYVDKARQRIAALKDAPAPWADDAPSPISGSASGPALAVSAKAEAATIAIFSYFLVSPPPSAVAIFPKEDGGLRLQTVGEERTVVVDVSPDGHEFAGEYAGDDVFHTEVFRSATDAAQFIVHSSR